MTEVLLLDRNLFCLINPHRAGISGEILQRLQRLRVRPALDEMQGQRIIRIDGEIMTTDAPRLLGRTMHMLARHAQDFIEGIGFRGNAADDEDHIDVT